MGDTGSLALGGFVASSAYDADADFHCHCGHIYLVEVLSVIIQVSILRKPVANEFLRWRRFTTILNCADGQKRE